ncbi:PrgI family protein [Patescibacteria group bacterium]|nr:PrgI family protein [Patescibacteria group bacterium]
MQFKVPQFLEIEDKIFGPFTFKEFVYLAGGAGVCFVLFKLLGLLWGLIPIIIVASLSALLTFYKPNNKPFINMLESMFRYTFDSKLYIWKRRVLTQEEATRERIEKRESLEPMDRMSKLTGSKLRDLAWSLDVLDLKKE